MFFRLAFHNFVLFLARFPGKHAPDIAVNGKSVAAKQSKSTNTVEQILGRKWYKLDLNELLLCLRISSA